MRTCIVLAACSLLFVACGPSAEDVVGQRKAGALARLARYREVVHQAVANPVRTPPKLDRKLDLKGGDATVQFLHVEWVEQPIEHAESGILFEINDFIDARNWCMGSSPMSAVTGASATRSFDAFEAKRLLVALETQLYQAGYASEGKFSPGSFTGRIHFIDVEKGSLGSIDVDSASTTAEIQAYEGHEQGAVKSDTNKVVREAINRALEPYVVAGQRPL